MTRRRPRGQEGVVRGCCLLIALLIALLAGAAFMVDRAVAAPELGASPRGPDHGDSEAAIAVSLGVQLAAELVAQPHGTVTLSEHDLSVLAAAHNPQPTTFSGVAVRVRDHLLAVSGAHPFGPFSVTAVARMQLSLDASQAPPSLTTQVQQLDVGELTIPGFLRDRILGGLAGAISLDHLFAGSPALRALRANIECVDVALDGVRVGVHRPGTAADPSICGG